MMRSSLGRKQIQHPIDAGNTTAWLPREHVPMTSAAGPADVHSAAMPRCVMDRRRAPGGGAGGGHTSLTPVALQYSTRARGSRACSSWVSVATCHRPKDQVLLTAW